MRLTEDEFLALTLGSSHNTKKKTHTKLVIANGYRSNVSGDRTIGGKTFYFRSLWEINFARYLQFLKQHKNIKDWEFEPEIFEFPRTAHKGPPFQYLPDFWVLNNDNSEEWYEVKGFMNTQSKKKIKRFRQHFPDEKITVIGKPWFSKEGKKLSRLVVGWETMKSNRGHLHNSPAR